MHAFEVAPDAESYDFTPLDYKNPEHRKLLEDVWKWEGEMDGKPWADGVSFPCALACELADLFDVLENLQIDDSFNHTKLLHAHTFSHLLQRERNFQMHKSDAWYICVCV